MVATRSLGRQFGWLWAAFAVSTFGTCLAFEAYALIAIIVLHSGPTKVSVLAAAGRAVGAVHCEGRWNRPRTTHDIDTPRLRICPPGLGSALVTPVSTRL